MLPNNNDTLYRYSRLRSQEIRDEVESARDYPMRPHILRRRITILAGLALVGLTVVVMTLALGWWIL